MQTLLKIINLFSKELKVPGTFFRMALYTGKKLFPNYGWLRSKKSKDRRDLSNDEPFQPNSNPPERMRLIVIPPTTAKGAKTPLIIKTDQEGLLQIDKARYASAALNPGVKITNSSGEVWAEGTMPFG